jgi:hypothetical protein
LRKKELEPIYHRYGKKGRIRNISLSSVSRYIKKQVEKEDVKSELYR